MSTPIPFEPCAFMQGSYQILRVSLGSLLRCLVGDHLRLWDLVLSVSELAYNSSVNRTTIMSPFEIVISYKLRAPIDLILMLATHRPSKSAFVFA